MKNGSQLSIPHSAVEVLAAARVEGNAVFLPGGQLERKLYESVNQALELLGGKWNRKQRAHLFEEDPTDIIESAVLSGEVTDRKKLFQFFETPTVIARRMVHLAEIKATDEILEPSAGRGAILQAVFEVVPEASVTAVELDPDNVKVLVRNVKGRGFSTVQEGDFLALYAAGSPCFDKILMNPPFTRQQDIDHVMRAYSLLKPGGTLVSVMSQSAFFRKSSKSSAFLKLHDAVGGSEHLPDSAFKESGTMVQTRIVTMGKVAVR